MKPKNALYAQSGGVTAVINASAAGVIETARKHRNRIGKVYAGRDGIIGALTEDLIDTSREHASAISRLKTTPGGAFGSCRYKLKGIDENRAHYERLIEVFRAHDIGYFFYNGGNDSADTAWKISQVGEKLGYPLICVGIPKTVDNDLALTDNCPGFGSVAKYVATSIREAGFDVASMAKTSTRVFVMEVMGRHAGWITAACGLASDREGDAPQILLFPEIQFDEEKFLERVRKVVERDGYCAIAVSEGLRNEAGQFLSNAVMPVIERVSNKPYRWRIAVANLADIANKEKMMPRNFITEDGFHITSKCRAYLSPLIQGEAPPPYKDGLPDYVKLKNTPVPKKLPAFKI